MSIPADCKPTTLDETVMEILAGPDKDGNFQFCLYFHGTGHFTGVQAQMFNAKLEDHMKGEIRLIDRRGK